MSEMSAYEKRIEARWRKYPGFGEEHTNAEWAKLFGLPRNTFRRYLLNGMTVEQIAQARGVKYPA